MIDDILARLAIAVQYGSPCTLTPGECRVILEALKKASDAKEEKK